MRAARMAIGRRSGWLAALAVLVASLVFIGEAAAQPVYGIATGKECAGPINVGDAYVCVASISNTNSTSLGTVTTNLVVDQVFHPDGTTAGAPQTVAINSSTVFPAGPVHLIDNGVPPAPTCDATKCTIPFGDEITVGLSHYTAQLQDVGSSALGQDTLSDIANFSYRQVCDKPVGGFPCSTALNISGSGAATDVNPVPTSTATAIHNNAGGGTVTSVAAGTTVHDFVTVTGVPGQPGPAGTVDVQWFTDGGCTQPFTSHKVETLVPNPGGGFSTVDATDFPQGPLAAGHYSFQANYLGDGNTPSQFAPSQGPCEPLTVVDAYIQITPQNAPTRSGRTTCSRSRSTRPAAGSSRPAPRRRASSPRRARPAASSAPRPATTRAGRRRRPARSRSPRRLPARRACRRPPTIGFGNATGTRVSHHRDGRQRDRRLHRELRERDEELGRRVHPDHAAERRERGRERTTF